MRFSHIIEVENRCPSKKKWNFNKLWIFNVRLTVLCDKSSGHEGEHKSLSPEMTWND